MQKEAKLIGLGEENATPQTAGDVLHQVVETEQALRGLYKEIGATSNWRPSLKPETQNRIIFITCS